MKDNDLLAACPKQLSAFKKVVLVVGGWVVALACTVMLAIATISPS